MTPEQLQVGSRLLEAYEAANGYEEQCAAEELLDGWLIDNAAKLIALARERETLYQMVCLIMNIPNMTDAQLVELKTNAQEVIRTDAAIAAATPDKGA